MRRHRCRSAWLGASVSTPEYLAAKGRSLGVHVLSNKGQGEVDLVMDALHRRQDHVSQTVLYEVFVSPFLHPMAASIKV